MKHIDSLAASTALSKFSLLGQGARLDAKAQAIKSVLGSAIIAGQATAVYAAPNVGKTLVLLHLGRRLISGDP